MAEKSKNDIINLRRAQLTKAAYTVINKKGFYNFTIRDIAKEAELSTGLVHYYFKDKQDLLLKLLKEMNDNMKKYLKQCYGDTDDPGKKLNIFLKQAFELAKDKEYFSVIADFWTQTNRNERMKRANIALMKSYRDEISGILNEGIEKGIFVEMNVPYFSTKIISLMHGFIIQYVIDNNAFDFTEFTQKVIHEISEMVLKKET